MKTTAPDTRPTLTPAKVAVRVGVSSEAAAHWMATGELRSIDVGKATRKFRRTSEAWLAEFLARAGTTSSASASGPAARPSGGGREADG